MKKWVAYSLVALLGLTLVGGTAVVYAQRGETPPEPPEAAQPPQFEPPLPDGFHPQQPHPRPPRALAPNTHPLKRTSPCQLPAISIDRGAHHRLKREKPRLPLA